MSNYSFPISQAHQEQTGAYSSSLIYHLFLNDTYTLHHIQFHKTASAHINIRHIIHISIPGQHLPNIEIIKKTMKANANHIIQANCFCLAHTHSGFLFLTKDVQIIKKGEYFGHIKTLINKSSVIIGTIILASNGVCVVNEKTKAIIHKTNINPAHALTALSSNTG
jgi:hypothetical protein